MIHLQQQLNLIKPMISQRQLQQWRIQSLKDLEEYKRDQQNLKELQGFQKPQMRTFFEKLRAKYFNFQNQENDKLSRLLVYTEMQKQMEHYPQILNTYVTYNTCSIIVLGACILAPKKIISKIIISLVTYGLKKNITDGMFTYYMIQNMALSNKMTEQQQELRNVIEFHYMHKFYTKSLISEEEKKQASQLIANIQAINQTYRKFRQVEKLI